MSQTKTSWLALIVLLGLIIIAVVHHANKPRVMILHSYDPGYIWTREVDIGLHRVVDNWQDFTVSWYYMDTKRHSDPIMLEKAGAIARQAVKQTRPDVLIAIDDNAQKYVGKYFVDDPSINIVFAGVNRTVEPYGYIGSKNVTGIYEHKQLDAVKEIIQAIEREKSLSKKKSLSEVDLEKQAKPRLLYILDPSATLQNERVAIDSYPWEPIDYIGSIRANNFAHWKEIILENSQYADYIMIANYRKLPVSSIESRFVDPKQVMSWTDASSPVPVIGVNMFNVEDGAMLSIGASAIEQGEVAANMTKQIIEQKIQAGQIDMRLNKQYVVSFRKEALSKRDIFLPKVYETFTHATARYKE